MAQNTKQREYSEQDILNRSYDRDLGLLMFLAWGYNGVGGQVNSPDAMETKITTSGTTTYIGIAAPGTAQATAKWQAKKISVSGSDTLIQWADGANFSQASTDLTSLTYV